MHRRLNTARVACAAVAVVALAALAFVPAASAHSGEWSKFNNCPSTNPEVNKCITSTVSSGEVVLGSKKVPIVNPVVLQGGYGFPEEGFSQFVGATNGVTLSKASQPVPGGLAGFVNCKEISNFILRTSCEWTLENGITGLNSTVELAQPASAIKISESHLLFGKGVALVLPVKVHLENPFLGSSCYIGSSSSPILWNLTTGTTAPPAPNTPIKGNPGTGEAIEGGGIFKISGTKLVDNAWSAPGASGCGGPIVELLLDPIINAASGVPAAAGKNTVVQNTTSYSANAVEVNEH
jgi:hypothetical protein